MPGNVLANAVVTAGDVTSAWKSVGQNVAATTAVVAKGFETKVDTLANLVKSLLDAQDNLLVDLKAAGRQDLVNLVTGSTSALATAVTSIDDAAQFLAQTALKRFVNTVGALVNPITGLPALAADATAVAAAFSTLPQAYIAFWLQAEANTLANLAQAAAAAAPLFAPGQGGATVAQFVSGVVAAASGLKALEAKVVATAGGGLVRDVSRILGLLG